MAEYYIKKPDTDHARGPLTLEQLQSLAETNSIDHDTLLYDDLTEKWKPLAAYTELVHEIFPEKKSLTLRKDKDFAPENQKKAKEESLTTEKMLAAAKGETKETRHIGAAKESRQKAAGLSLPGLACIAMISAVAFLYPSMDILLFSGAEDIQLSTLLSSPFIIIGLVDLALGIFLFLGMADLFPLVRIRAALATGFLVYVFWAWQNLYFVAAACLVGIAFYIGTVASRYSWMLLALILGIIGSTFFAYAAFTGALS